MHMNKIIKELKTKIVIEKSKFFCYIFFCSSHAMQTEILKQIKRENLSATHICYASLIYSPNGILQYSSDDGEPSGTAGLQILQALKEQELINTLCVVVRYFGGIKLGVSGLGRAYKESALSCMNENKREVTLKTKFKLLASYNNFNKIKPYLLETNTEILEQTFNNDVTFYAYLNSSQQEYLKNYATLENLNESNYY